MQREKRDIDILREITEDIGGVDNKLQNQSNQINTLMIANLSQGEGAMIK